MRNEDRQVGTADDTGNARDDPRDAPREPEFSVAFSPRQVAGGFAILAALILLVVRRRRGKKQG